MTLKTYITAIAFLLFTPLIALADDQGIAVHSPWIRATVATAPVAGGFAMIENSGDEEDWLIGGEVDFAGEVQVHEMSMSDGVMRMRQLADGLVVPAGGSVLLKPGSFHLMFMKLGQQLVAGEKLSGILHFAKAGDIAVEFDVVAMGETHAPMKHN